MFGFFKKDKGPSAPKFVPLPLTARLNAIRRWLRIRIESDPTIADGWPDPEGVGSSLEGLDDEELGRTPEAVILVLVEQYLAGRAEGLSPGATLDLIHRVNQGIVASVGIDLGPRPRGDRLDDYGRFYLNSLPAERYVSTEHLNACMAAALSLYPNYIPKV